VAVLAVGFVAWVTVLKVLTVNGWLTGTCMLRWEATVWRNS